MWSSNKTKPPPDDAVDGTKAGTQEQGKQTEEFTTKSLTALPVEPDAEDKNAEEGPAQVEEKPPGCCKRTGKACKKTFLTSISLLLINLFYVAMGGFIFHILERDSGKSNSLEFNKQINATIDVFNEDYLAFQNAYDDKDNDKQDELVAHSCDVLKYYQANITNAYRNDGWRYNTTARGQLWSYSASVLFCITVITTIGYGNMVPSSTTTRVLTIVYALIGIPLMLMFIHHLGDHLGQGFEWFFYHATCMGERRPRRSRKEKRLRKERKKREQKYKPEKKKKNYIKKICIPLHVSICVIGSYLSLGGLLFSKHGLGVWEFENAIYFSFVTLSTIGFGDLVFNQEEDTADGIGTSVQVKAIICGLYIIFGLALMSMCFDHMTFTFREQFHVLGDMVAAVKERFCIRKKSSSFVDVQAEDPDPAKKEPEKDTPEDERESPVDEAMVKSGV